MMLEKSSIAKVCLLAFVALSVSCGSDAGETANGTPASSNEARSKVLVRNRNTGNLAVDGLLFQVHMLTAASGEDLKDQLWLRSDPAIEVREESGMEYRSPAGEKETPTPVAWKLDPKDFDFFVTWTVDSIEQKKSSFNEDLVIDVKEDWKVEKVSDPTKSQSWSFAYRLRAPGGFQKGLLEKTAIEQTNVHILPARVPILRDLKAFIAANK